MLRLDFAGQLLDVLHSSGDSAQAQRARSQVGKLRKTLTAMQGTLELGAPCVTAEGVAKPFEPQANGLHASSAPQKPVVLNRPAALASLLVELNHLEQATHIAGCSELPVGHWGGVGCFFLVSFPPLPCSK